MNAKNNAQETNKEKLNSATQKPAPKPEKTEPTVAQLAEDVAHWKDLAMRATAEMENLKKRTQIDIAKANRYAMGSFAKDLLPVADSLDQALSFARGEIEKEKQAGGVVNPILDNLLKGVEMTAGKLVTALK